MNRDEAEKLMGRVCKLFPQTTREQVKAAGKQFLRFQNKTVYASLEEHPTKFQFFTLSELVKACEETERVPNANGRATIPDQSYADVIRRVDDQLRPVKCDIEVIIRSYRKQWHACGMRGEYRDMIGRQCATALIGLTVDGETIDQETAGRWADTIFESVEDFRNVLYDLRNRRSTAAPKSEDGTPAWRQTFDAVKTHFEACWRLVEAGNADACGKAAARATILRHAAMALADLRFDGNPMEPADIRDWAGVFVGLKSGQRIPQADWPRQITHTGKTSRQAIEELARHEHAVKAIPEPVQEPVGSISA